MDQQEETWSMVMSVCGYFVILCPGNPMQQPRQWKCVCLSSDYLICQRGQVYLSAWPSPTPDLGLIHGRITCAPSRNIFSSPKKYFLFWAPLSLPDSPLVGGTEVGKLADWCEVRTLKWVWYSRPPSILLTQQKFKLDTKGRGGGLLNAKELNLFVMNGRHNFWAKLITF